jgi:hypothetical protein
MDKYRKVTLHMEITSESAFSDLVHLDCIADILDDRIKDSASHEDQTTMRRWLKTVYKLSTAYEKALED